MARSARSRDTELSIADKITAAIDAAYAAATDEDRAKVAALVEKAMAHSPTNELYELIEYTPGMAALIIIEHNKRNREFTPEHVGNLADDMAHGRWRKNGDTYTWYLSGQWADGAHRLRGQMLSGVTLVMPTFFSMDQNDIGTKDCGLNRPAWLQAQFEGIAFADKKEPLLRAIWNYEKSVRIFNDIPVANHSAVSAEIRHLDKLLQTALNIAADSMVDVEGDTPLKELWASRVAGVLLRHGWPGVKVKELMEEFQAGEFVDERCPLARTRAYIDGNRPQPATLSAQAAMNMTIKAMLMTEEGIAASKKMTEIISAAKNPPNPAYPIDDAVAKEVAE
jgi:hypothetical protein